MLRFTDLTGLLSAAILATAALLTLPGVGRLSRARLGVLLGSGAILALLPLRPLPPVGYLRGFLGDLSITTLVLLLRAICRPFLGWGRIGPQDRLAVQSLAGGGALVFYPLALGMGTLDPYRLGFANPWFLGALLLLALAGWSRGLYLLSLCLALAVLAYAVGWYESRNLWDYLLDPLVSLYSLAGLLFRGAKTLLGRRS
jgi:hypothetical protein